MRAASAFTAEVCTGAVQCAPFFLPSVSLAKAVSSLATGCYAIQLGWVITSLFSSNPGEEEGKKVEHTQMCAGGDCTVIMETVCEHFTPFFVAQPNSWQQAFLLRELHPEGLLLMPRA